MPPLLRLLTALPFLLIGSVVFLIGLYKLIEESRRRKQRAVGEVVHVDAIPTVDSDGVKSTLYRPTFRFDTPAGPVQRAWAGHADADWSYPVGTRMPVCYDPADDAYVRPVGARHAHLAPVLMTLIGGGACGFGLFRLLWW